MVCACRLPGEADQGRERLHAKATRDTAKNLDRAAALYAKEEVKVSAA